MGLSDRDYMRDRYRKQGGAASIPVWNDKKGRVEREDVPLGSASWVGKNTEFDEYDRIAMRYGRRRRTRTGRAGWTPALRGLIPILCLVPVAIGILADAKRRGWLPDFQPAITFPESGSVAVARTLPLGLVQSRLRVSAAEANAVVQLIDPHTGAHALSVFVAANDDIDVPAPAGRWRMRIVEGQKWHGPKDFFGPNTQFETVAKLMDFPARGGNGINLHRRFDGNLSTRQMLTGPDPL